MNGLPFSDALHLIRASHVPLIIIPRQPATDPLAAGLALLVALERLGKAAQLVSPNFQLPSNHGFLPKSDAIRSNLNSLRSFIINVSTKNTKLDALSYSLEGDQLQIFLTPKSGYYEARDVTTSSGSFAYDLIILLGVTTLSDLGDLYEQNAEFFYQTPTVAIDTAPAHDRYARVNLVDVVASSVSEVVFETLKQLDPAVLDEHIATSLLTGIIASTKGFQAQTVTPRSLGVAAHLISAGARRDEIVRQLYQTKTLPALRLWGRALSAIQSSADNKIVWTTLSKEDLAVTKTTPTDAPGVLDELMVNTPTADTFALFVEGHQGTHVFLATTQPRQLTLPEGLEYETPTYVRGEVRRPLREAVQLIMNSLAPRRP